ncbi:uncharacterized protein PHA67_000263 [Liasis olivaceus]
MVEPSRLSCLETREGSRGISSAGIRMQGWFSLNRRLRRSSYEKNRRLSEDDEHQREIQNEVERDTVVGEGCLLQLRAEPGPAAASGDPEAPSKAHAPPLVPDSLAPEDTALEPALPAPVPPQEMVALIQELQAAHEFQSSHFQERRQDLRRCHDCLKSLKTLKEHLQAVKTRLWHVEAALGIHVPPQELDPEDELEGPRAQESPCGPDVPPARPLPDGGA